jgi:phosphoglycerate dehydrogenase-like enzyme
VSSIVFYLNPGATPDVLSIIREELPPNWRLLPAEGSDFAAQLSVCDFILVPDQPVRAEHLAAAPRLKMIQHQGVGYERIDLAACGSRKIPVCLTPEGTTTGVAEHTILLILALYKRLVVAATGVSAGRWMQWELRSRSFELAGKSLGLVGLGRIGREVARRAISFDCQVSYFDPVVTTADDLRLQRCGSLDELVSTSDIISLHLPVTAASRKLVNSDLLGKFKAGSALINTARGALVDEQALLAALHSGRLAGAALDVLEKEPPDTANPLLHMENVLITPHIAAGTRDALKTKMRAAFANMQRLLRGEPLWHLVPELANLFDRTA